MQRLLVLLTFFVFLISGIAVSEAAYQDNGDGTVTDTATGLMWQKISPSDTMTWRQALAHCENLSLGDHADWRLPTIKELKSLVDHSRYDPAINTTYFPDTVASWYWSSSTYAYDTSYAWVVDFYDGHDYRSHKPHSRYVRAVRGGQSSLGSFGSLIISLEPAEARTAGAQWRRKDTSTWRSGGDMETGIEPGVYTIEFKPVDDWLPPDDMHITVTADETATADARYQYNPVTTSNRAAILVLPRGRNENDIPAIRTMVVYAYNALRERFFRKDDIYLLAHTPAVGTRLGAELTDDIVSAPVTLADYRNGVVPRDVTAEDIRRAFDWARAKGTLDEPLLFMFAGHGLKEDGDFWLELAPSESELVHKGVLGGMLEDYQKATGNKVAVVVEACYSGKLLPELAGSNRILVTSTGLEQAVFLENGYGSFSRFFFRELRIRKTYLEAFEDTVRELRRIETFSRQIPQLDDNGDGRFDENDGLLAAQWGLNREVDTLSRPVVLTSHTTGRTVRVGETVDLRVEAGVGAQSVWATVLTPATALHLDAYGFPLQPAPRIELVRHADSRIRTGTFSDFQHRGTYTVIFNATDSYGFVTSSAPVVFTLATGPEPTAAPVPTQPVFYRGDTLRVRIPAPLDGHASYVVLSISGLADLLVLTDTNTLSIFDPAFLPPWTSTGDVVLNLDVVDGFPEGRYSVFLLRVPTGVNPLVEPSGWKLGMGAFDIQMERPGM